MSSASVDVGNGASLTFGSSAFSAEITSMEIADISRDPIETTHLGSTNVGAGKVGGKEYILPTLADTPMLNIEGHFNPDTVPPVDDDIELITITFASGATWAGSGGMTSYNPGGIAVDSKMTFSASVKFTGPVTITGA